MATIYEKTAIDKVLILGPKEGLIYSFDLGDWTEIRAGIETYTTAASGFTFTGEPYAISRSVNPENAFFFGFVNTNAGTGRLPLQNQSKFIGVSAGSTLYNYSNMTPSFFCCGIGNNNDHSRAYNIADYSGTGVNDLFNLKMICSDSSNLTGLDMFKTASPREGFKMSNSGALVNLTENYSVRNGISITITNPSSSGTQMGLLTYFSSKTNGTSLANSGPFTTPDMNMLRNFLLNRDTAAYSSSSQFLLTSGFSPTGNAIDMPNALFFYNPFPNHNIAIANLLIEKYA